jgi:hypothetical protein
VLQKTKGFLTERWIERALPYWIVSTEALIQRSCAFGVPANNSLGDFREREQQEE